LLEPRKLTQTKIGGLEEALTDMHPGDAKMVFLVPELAYACPPGKVFTRPSSIPDTKQRERRGSVKRFFFFFLLLANTSKQKTSKKKNLGEVPLLFLYLFKRENIYTEGGNKPTPHPLIHPMLSTQPTCCGMG
jgi:hypothetical protein